MKGGPKGDDDHLHGQFYPLVSQALAWCAFLISPSYLELVHKHKKQHCLIEQLKVINLY